MPFAPTLIFMVIFCLESLVAMLQNGFMITVLGREWVHGRALPAGDMIVACLSASRFCLHGLSILNNFLLSYAVGYKYYSFGILWDFINTLASWFTTWLAIFYCVKISSFSHPIFFWMKWKISRLVPRLLLGSTIIGGFSTISSATGHVVASHMMISYGNCTLAYRTIAFSRHFYKLHAILMWVTPFLLFLISIILLMVSLYRHLGQMRDLGLRPGNPSTQAHTAALKSLAFFFIFYTSYVLSLMMSAFKVIIIPNSWYWAWELVAYTGIFLHSTILMLSHPKLRKALKMNFWGPLCYTLIRL